MCSPACLSADLCGRCTGFHECCLLLLKKQVDESEPKVKLWVKGWPSAWFIFFQDSKYNNTIVERDKIFARGQMGKYAVFRVGMWPRVRRIDTSPRITAVFYFPHISCQRHYQLLLPPVMLLCGTVQFSLRLSVRVMGCCRFFPSKGLRGLLGPNPVYSMGVGYFSLFCLVKDLCSYTVRQFVSKPQ